MLAYTEIERAVVMYLELLKSKAHMASWQAEFKLKDEALQSPEGRFASITLPRLKLFCSMFKPAAAFKGCGCCRMRGLCSMMMAAFLCCLACFPV